MAIKFKCSNCGKSLRATEQSIGMTANCPGCGETVTVPNVDELEANAPPVQYAETTQDDDLAIEEEHDVGHFANGSDFEAGEYESDEAVSTHKSTASDGPVPHTSYLVDFLVFRRMATPILIQIAFWFGIAVSVPFGLFGLVVAVIGLFSGEIISSFFGLLMAMVYLVGIPLFLRIAVESIILFFRMNETMTDIRNRLD